jgi:soluble lytic murein transglycosylase-like protein
MEALALIVCIGVLIYGLANHKNETIIISCVLVCVLGVSSLFSLTRTPVETTEIVNEEGEDDSEEHKEKPVESNSENEVIEQTPNEKLKTKATRYAKKFRIDAKLFHALIQQESRWKVDIRSRNAEGKFIGATGLGQIMPFNVPLCTKEKLNESERVAWLKNPDNNLHCSAKILKSELVYWDRKFPDNAEKAIKHALGSYNAGRSAVEFKNAITAYRETRNYVATIWSNYNG